MDKNVLCATVVPGDGEGQKANQIAERIVSCCYEACRGGRRELEGFPDFNPLVAELQGLSASNGHQVSDSYKVTACLPCGALVIKNQFHEQFQEVPEFEAILADHNSRFNKDNLSLNDPESSGASPEESNKQVKTTLVATEEPIKAETISNLAHPPGPYLNIHGNATTVSRHSK